MVGAPNTITIVSNGITRQRRRLAVRASEGRWQVWAERRSTNVWGGHLVNGAHDLHGSCCVSYVSLAADYCGCAALAMSAALL